MTAGGWLGRALAAAVCALAISGTLPRAAAQPVDQADDEAVDQTGAAPAARGAREYGGVVPGRPGPAPPGARGGKPPARATVTWVGFQALPGRARVFLQLSTAVTYEQVVVGRELIVRIPGVRLDLENNARPLDTRFFAGDVAGVAARSVRPRTGDDRRTRASRAVEVRVSFKEGAAPRTAAARLEAASDGYQYLYLELPTAP